MSLNSIESDDEGGELVLISPSESEEDDLEEQVDFVEPEIAPVLQQTEEDGEYTEELILLNFPEWYSFKDVSQVAFSGLDTPNPVVHFGEQAFFVGRHEETVGTSLIFSPPPDQNTPPTLIASLTESIVFEPATIDGCDLNPPKKIRPSGKKKKPQSSST